MTDELPAYRADDISAARQMMRSHEAQDGDDERDSLLDECDCETPEVGVQRVFPAWFEVQIVFCCECRHHFETLTEDSDE
jgi:hypothetical protein